MGLDTQVMGTFWSSLDKLIIQQGWVQDADGYSGVMPLHNYYFDSAEGGADARRTACRGRKRSDPDAGYRDHWLYAGV